MKPFSGSNKTNPNKANFKLEANLSLRERRSLRVSFSESSNRGPISKAKKCVSLVNVADLSNDGPVDYKDMILFTDKWPFEKVLLAEDLDRSGFVNFIDFAIFAGNWLWEQ